MVIESQPPWLAACLFQGIAEVVKKGEEEDPSPPSSFQASPLTQKFESRENTFCYPNLEAFSQMIFRRNRKEASFFP